MREEKPVDKEIVTEVLQVVGRDAMKYLDGDHFPRNVFAKQATAIMELFAPEIEKAAMYDGLCK